MPGIRNSITDSTDDTEGHGTRFKGVSDGVEDDAEGNIARPGRSVPPAANPGKGARASH